MSYHAVLDRVIPSGLVMNGNRIMPIRGVVHLKNGMVCPIMTMPVIVVAPLTIFNDSHIVSMEQPIDRSEQTAINSHNYIMEQLAGLDPNYSNMKIVETELIDRHFTNK